MTRKIQWLQFVILALGVATQVTLLTVEGELWKYFGSVAVLFYVIITWAGRCEDGEVPVDCKIAN